MFGFGAISEAPFSAQMVTTHPAGASLNASASMAFAPVMSVKGASLASGPATVSAVGVLSHAAKAVITSDIAFTNGFTNAFQRGSTLSGNGTVTQTGLSTFATLIANGTIERSGSSSLLAGVTLSPILSFQYAIIADLQSVASLSGNSVLLHSGSINLNALATLIDDANRPDVVSFTSYIDKGRSIDGNICRTQDLIAYIDKQLSITSSIDKTSGITGYIDKVVEKTLVKER
tara:strand:- start:331 stop:1026 length:696 start_codon:yes stop_codon:yes gene_type:complete